KNTSPRRSVKHDHRPAAFGWKLFSALRTGSPSECNRVKGSISPGQRCLHVTLMCFNLSEVFDAREDRLSFYTAWVMGRNARSEQSWSTYIYETGSVVARGASLFRANKRHSLQLRKNAEVNYSITSSARPSSVSGTVRPSALAVLRLMISSTFVDCCT